MDCNFKGVEMFARAGSDTLKTQFGLIVAFSSRPESSRLMWAAFREFGSS